MTGTITWQRIALTAFILASLALLLYALGAPDYPGG